MIKFASAFILTAVLLSCISVVCVCEDYSSEIVMVGDTGEVAFGENIHSKLPMASTTKIITAIVAIENTDIHKTVCIPAEATDIEGSSIYLYKGESITVEQLLYGLLLCSGNDAATAVAIATSGSVEDFVVLMNEFCQKLGLSDTSLTNPHGLYDANHYTSACDLATVMRYCMKNETFARIVKTKSIYFDMPDGTRRFFYNHNRLLSSYEYTVGGKTGFTKASGRCLVTAAIKDGVMLICVTLNVYDDFERHKDLYETYFKEYNSYLINYDKNSDINIVGSKKDTVSVTENADVYLALKNSEDKSKIKKKIYVSRFYYSPVIENETVGKVEYYYDGRYIASVDLIACENAEVYTEKNFWQKILDYIRRLFT